MMYNSEVKKEYLQTLENDWEIKKTLSIFNKVFTLERKRKKDLYNISYEEAMEYLNDERTFSSYYAVDTIYNRIKKYKLWALKKGYMSDRAKPFVTDKSAKEKIILKSQGEIFRSPKELVDRVIKMFDPISDDMVTKLEMASASMMLCYQGFTLNEVLELTLKNIIFTENNIIIYNDRIAVKVYEEFKPLLTKIYNNRVLIEYEGKHRYVDIETDSYITFSPEKADIKITKEKIVTLVYQRITMPKKLSIKFEKLNVMGALYEAESRGLLQYIDKKQLGILRERKKVLYSCYGTVDISRNTIAATIAIFKLW